MPIIEDIGPYKFFWLFRVFRGPVTFVAIFRPLLTLLQALAVAMTAPGFASFTMILAGWVFAPRRTVTGMIVAAGMAGVRHHSIFHRFFARACWSLDALGLAVFGRCRGTCVRGARSAVACRRGRSR